MLGRVCRPTLLVGNIHVVKDRQTGQNKGFAFVNLSSQEIALKVHGAPTAPRPPPHHLQHHAIPLHSKTTQPTPPSKAVQALNNKDPFQTGTRLTAKIKNMPPQPGQASALGGGQQPQGQASAPGTLVTASGGVKRTITGIGGSKVNL